MDLGAPVSYLVVETGVPVYDPAGEEIGKLEHVLAAQDADIFDGLIVDTRLGPGGWRFADAEQVEELYERGVVLRAGANELHEPSGGAPVVDAAAAEGEDAGSLQAKLRRAWDYVSGNY